MVLTPPASGPTAMDVGPEAHQAPAAAAQQQQPPSALHEGGPAPHAPIPPAREHALQVPAGSAQHTAAGPPAERQQEPAQERSALAAAGAAVSAAFAQVQPIGTPPSAPAVADAGLRPGHEGCDPHGLALQSDPDPFSMYPRRAADTGAASAEPPGWSAMLTPQQVYAPGGADAAMSTAPPAPAWPAMLPPQERPPFGALQSSATMSVQGHAPPTGARTVVPPGFGALPIGMGAAQAAGAPTSGAPAGIRPPPPGFGGPQPAAGSGTGGFGGATAGYGAAVAAQDGGAWVRHPGRVAELAGGPSGRSSRTESPVAGQVAGGCLFPGTIAPASGYPSFGSDAALSTDGGGSAARPLTRPPSAAALGAGLARRPSPNPGWGLPGAAHTGAQPPSVLPLESQLLGGGGGSLGAGSFGRGARDGAGPGGGFSSLFGRDMFAAQRGAPAPAFASSASPSVAAVAAGMGGLAPHSGAQAQRGGLGSYGAASAQPGGTSLFLGDTVAGRTSSGGFQGLGAGLGLGFLGGAHPPTAASRLGIRSEPRPIGAPASAVPLQEALQRAALQSAALQAGALQHAPGRPVAQGSGWPGGAGTGAGFGFGQGLTYEQQLALLHGNMVAPSDRAYRQPGGSEQGSGQGGLSGLLGTHAQPQGAPASAGPHQNVPVNLQGAHAQPHASAPASTGAHFAPGVLASLQGAYAQPQASAPAPPGAHFASGGLADFYAQGGGRGGDAYGAQQGPAALDALGQMRQLPPGASAYGTPYAGANPAAWGNLASLGSSMGGGEAGQHAGLETAGPYWDAAGPHAGGAGQPAAPAQLQPQQAAALLSYADMDGLRRMQAAAMGGAAAQGMGSESGFGPGPGAEQAARQYMLAQADLQLLQRLQSSVQAQQARGHSLAQDFGSGADPYSGAVTAGAGAAAGPPGGANPGQGAAEGAGAPFSWLSAFATRPAQPNSRHMSS